MTKKKQQLTAFYDGSCPLCDREMDHYRKKDCENKMAFVDISTSGFDAQSVGLDPERVHQYFHVQTPDGRIVEGVEAFVEIWMTLGVFPLGVSLARHRLTRSMMDAGYNIFAKFRPYLPKKKCEKNCEWR